MTGATSPTMQNRCHSCLKETTRDFCPACTKRLFGVKKFNATLDFSLPEIKSNKGSIRRISISGAQPKFSLMVNEGRLEPTENGGTFILKPAVEGLFDNTKDMPANEHLTMQMARQIFKIDAADNALVYLKDGTPAYITKRFDVLPDGNRICQEDFAQVAGLTPGEKGSNYKYDFSYQQIADLMKQYVSTYPTDVEKYFRLILFNYLVCNGDAHVKNFSIYSPNADGVYKLTPAYDLLNTSLHVQELGRTALELFSENSATDDSRDDSGADFETEFFKVNGFYGKPDFMELARRIGIKEIRAERFIAETCSHLREMNAMIDRSYLSEPSKALFKAQVRDRAKALEMR
ncbi:HipA domain-containing protein [Fibrobacter sp. UWEL]|uniref:HipA domain-containing protein n=1 Tax=Fibrobacter sp. UWEL TaxID=1896209 RepID=UPI000910F8D8|nr:HipA domain-containing protein [Fibrobacter sp. UWEL]SHK70043.1 serine/threonine-protein kinase HipA [Fibrobacter sp. UWEL]